MQKKFRAFLAIDLPEEIKNDIIKHIKPLHSLLSPKEIKWVKKENLHITLYFLGSITNEQYHNLDQKIRGAIKEFPAFTMDLATLAPFPSPEKFHILALNPEPSTHLEELALLLKNEIISSEIEVETRDFRPHVTLGRVNRATTHELRLSKNSKTMKEKNISRFPIEALGNDDFSFSFKVTKITLFKSQTDPAGAIYTPVAIYQLNL